MYEEQTASLEAYASRLDNLRKCLNVVGVKAEIGQLERDMATPGFWDTPEAANKIVQKLKGLKVAIDAPEALQTEIRDAIEFVELARAEEDAALAAELEQQCVTIEGKLRRLELNSLLSDPRDAKDAIINIHPGAGGTESCDWASMLFRMLVRYCERRDYSVEVVDHQPGDEAGLKSATLTVSGPFAYGNLKSENGVHRLVRISPFDANSRRHTSFAAVEVLTQLDENIAIEIKEEDLKVDVFRSSGPGGQKVNKTSSAIRVTHLPTGIVTACQIERSQHRNRAMALEILKAKLYDLELKKKEQELASQRQGQMDVAWGSQIRSYVLQPYQLIKDHRTEVETGNVDRVLDGELDKFVEGYLRWSLERKSRN